MLVLTMLVLTMLVLTMLVLPMLVLTMLVLTMLVLTMLVLTMPRFKLLRVAPDTACTKGNQPTELTNVPSLVACSLNMYALPVILQIVFLLVSRNLRFSYSLPVVSISVCALNFCHCRCR